MSQAERYHWHLVGKGWDASKQSTVQSCMYRTALAATNHLAQVSVVQRLKTPGLDIEELDSFPEIKYELCSRAGRIGPQGSVESAVWQKPVFLLLWADRLQRVSP